MASESAPIKKKERKTLFWAISLKKEDVFENDIIDNVLKENPNIKPLKSIHSTLLYVGKKDNENEAIFFEHRYKECILEISGFAYYDKAMALKVDRLYFKDNNDTVPTFATIQHVTLALSDGTPAVESTKAFGEGTFIELPIRLEGKVMRY